MFLLSEEYEVWINMGSYSNGISPCLGTNEGIFTNQK